MLAAPLVGRGPVGAGGAGLGCGAGVATREPARETQLTTGKSCQPGHAAQGPSESVTSTVQRTRILVQSRHAAQGPFRVASRCSLSLSGPPGSDASPLDTPQPGSAAHGTVGIPQYRVSCRVTRY